ncbi:hypothetical protein [Chlorogloea sp. CCALA 695]|uniref:hypothetical protein n=1 Tax=Chlorogloea sp. CCALA 695 TaxID=2107693 RepID=UPI000D072F94|nr:hypothetical protein [Chlorogloea sp. CCALA 695]PSB28787.1 hypothetical protein C7B70_20080 [Chlorogloea sp. CCALA 695]
MKIIKYNQSQSQKELSYEILPASSTMIGVCVTVITLVKITNFATKTYAEELLAFDAFLFISAGFLSYISISRTNNIKIELIADISFLLGMFIMVIVGVLLLNLE